MNCDIALRKTKTSPKTIPIPTVSNRNRLAGNYERMTVK
jgi:hypothetical protein